MKVSSIYKLPMSTEENHVFSADSRYNIRTDISDTTCEEQAEVIAMALNNHDKLLQMVKDFDARSQNNKDYFNTPFESEVNRLLSSIESI